MQTIIIRENQFYDIHAPGYKLELEFYEKEKEVTFVVMKFINKDEDERIEEIHLSTEQLIDLTSKLNAFLKIKDT